jgi:hypothetical protein
MEQTISQPQLPELAARVVVDLVCQAGLLEHQERRARDLLVVLAHRTRMLVVVAAQERPVKHLAQEAVAATGCSPALQE